MIEWRKWIYERINAISDVADRVFSTVEKAEVPFVVVRFGTEQAEITNVAYSTEAVVWVHDDPGSYTRIDDLLKEIREAVEGDVTDANAIHATWAGNSPDLADDARGTITKNITFRLYGRR